jgi:hypothetical protein
LIMTGAGSGLCVFVSCAWAAVRCRTAGGRREIPAEVDRVEADRRRRHHFPALDTADFENESARFSPILIFCLRTHR